MKSDGNASKVPRHIGIIMDGNGRWAAKRLAPRPFGHRAGVKNITPIVKAAIDYGVECVSLYALSTENTARPKAEVDELVNLIRTKLPPMAKELAENGARIRMSGDIRFFPDDVQKVIRSVEQEYASLEKVVNIALNYGGREDIAQAAAKAAEAGAVNAESIERYLYTSGMPELDMIIRTGGEKRLSNFLLYQAAYSELFFSDTLWPDFDKTELYSLFDEYSHRTRKFGKV